MDRKIAFFAFEGKTMCFIHVLLNALEMKEKGCDVKIILEGGATSQVRELADPASQFSDLYNESKEKGIIDCVCRACAAKMEALESARSQSLNICNELKGHPSMLRYMEEGYEIIIT